MTQELATRDPFALPDRVTAETKFRAIAEFQKLVHSQMVVNLDYGVIPGTTKPTLLKPGAEKIAKLLGLADQYEVMDKVEDWDKGFFAYTIRCILQDMGSQVVVSSGLGSCNTKEARYRWREQKRKCPRCQQETIFKSKQAKGGWYCFGKVGGCGANFIEGDKAIESQQTGRVENDDTFSLVNTVLKMARKRALVDAALSAGRLSAIFTQDMEDITGTDVEGTTRVVDTSTGEIQERPVAPPVAPKPALGTEAPQGTKAGPVASRPTVEQPPLTVEAIKNVGDLLTYVSKTHSCKTARSTTGAIIGKDPSLLATAEECRDAADKVDAFVLALGKALTHATPEELKAAAKKVEEDQPF